MLFRFRLPRVFLFTCTYNSLQETINFGVIYAYLTCHDYSKEYQSKHGYFKRETLQDILNRENFMWAIAVKVPLLSSTKDATK